MAGLASAIAVEAQQRRGARCMVLVVRRRLDAEDAAALDEALVSPTTSGAAIVRALTQSGHTITENSVQRHRRGDCSCGRTA